VATLDAANARAATSADIRTEMLHIKHRWLRAKSTPHTRLKAKARIRGKEKAKTAKARGCLEMIRRIGNARVVA
jgi:hypothetical protein